MTRSARSPRPVGTVLGVLPVLAGLVIASALLRLGDGTALEIVHRLNVVGEAQADAHEAAPPDEIETVLSALRAREEQLDAEAQRLAEREAALNAAEERIAAQLAEIEDGEAELRRLLELVDQGAEDDVTRLATVYEAMKPAAAGALFREMPPAFAAGFLGRMSPPASAAILANLPPEAAYAISVTMAARHADLPDAAE